MLRFTRTLASAYPRAVRKIIGVRGIFPRFYPSGFPPGLKDLKPLIPIEFIS